MAMFVACIDRAIAATATANPAADAFVSSATPDGNFGGGGALEMSAAGLPKGEFQTLMRFDLAGVKNNFDATFGAGQWQVQAITLGLTTSNPSPQPIFNSNAAGSFNVSWMQNDSWIEGAGTPAAPGATGITFNTLSSFLSASDQSLGNFNFAGGTSGGATYTLSLASSFAADVLGGDHVSLRLSAGDGAVSYLFQSREFGTSSARPVLTVSVVPEPGIGAIFGIVVFATRRRAGRACLFPRNIAPRGRGG
jgi:hypothetical protein